VKSIYDLKIATKLLVSFSAVLILTAFLGVFSIIQLAKVNQTAADMEVNWMPSIQVLLEIKSTMQRIRTLEYANILFTDPANASKAQKLLDDSLVSFKKSNEQYVKLISEPEEKRIYGEFNKNWEKYIVEHDKIFQLLCDADSFSFNLK
jgi:methyl-accepting chemotaxis protein